MINVDVNACVGCGGCVDLCPMTAIRLVDDRSWVDPELCSECGICTEVCPLKAPRRRE